MLVRCAPSAYQTALSDLVVRKRQERAASRSAGGGGGGGEAETLLLGSDGGGGAGGGAGIQNFLMEQRTIANHPFLSRLHDPSLEGTMPAHPATVPVRLCGKLEALDRMLPKLKACGHRVLLFSTMTRILDVLEEYMQARCDMMTVCVVVVRVLSSPWPCQFLLFLALVFRRP